MRKTALVISIIAGILVLSAVVAIAGNERSAAVTETKIESNSRTLTPHAPIYIEGNAGFTPENGVVSGSGTEGNPYIIQNWDIDASTAHGVEIRNTDVYFIIRNYVIHDGKSNDIYGIYFYSVQNGKIDNVTSYNNEHGIWLDSSSNNQITNCVVYNSLGISLYYSSNNQITNCAVYDNYGRYGGIYLYSSSNNEIHFCNIYNNTNYGVYNENLGIKYQVNATYNWWGSGGTGANAGKPGEGGNNPVSSNVLYDPWLTKPWED